MGVFFVTYCLIVVECLVGCFVMLCCAMLFFGGVG